ncbi:uncharacterized protein LOC135944394 [Cloeon dipterum]|uniref:uncharacterized protein LOC135944394 n=1 Tax=Cloeon dipterum TaxID=197152 RepID=UPI0032209607
MKLLILLLVAHNFGLVPSDSMRENHQCLYTCGCMKYYGDAIEKRMELMSSGIITKNRATREPNSSYDAMFQSEKLVDFLEAEFTEIKNIVKLEFGKLEESLETTLNGVTKGVPTIPDQKSFEIRLQEHHEAIASAVSQQASLLNDLVLLTKKQFKAISADLIEVQKKQDSFEEIAHRRLKEVNTLSHAVSVGHKSVFLPSGKIIVIPAEILRATWSAGKEFCVNLGMNLVTAKNQMELDEFHDAAKKVNASTSFWLSASNLDGGDANFKWQDGTPLPINSTLWLTTKFGGSVDQPDDYKNETEVCVYLFTSNKKKLIDGACRFTSLVICQL